MAPKGEHSSCCMSTLTHSRPDAYSWLHVAMQMEKALSQALAVAGGIGGEVVPAGAWVLKEALRRHTSEEAGASGDNWKLSTASAPMLRL